VTGRTQLRLVVTTSTDGPNFDHADWADAKLTCGGTANTPPQAAITTPAASTTWRVGQTISFSGSATDAQDGTVPASRLSWALIVNHCPSTCHTHPVQTFDGVASGSFVAPDHEYPSDLELRLTATDAGGLTDVESVRLQPQTTALTFVSSPTGLQLVVGGTAGTAPFTRTVIVGSTNSVSATTPQTHSGTEYSWTSWSDGGAQTHTITAPAAATTYTATYAAAGDTTPPTVTGRTPAADATGVATSTTVSATFSEPMAAASITSSTFTLTKQGAGSPVAASLAYDGANRRATLTPAAALDAGSVYVARVRGGPGGVTDAAGNELAADHSWSFTTAATPPPPGTTTYLSDLTPVSATNGWGPYERDRSNGEQGAGDGGTLTLNGVTFTKGLGVHAVSELVYAVPAGCSTLSTTVGVDDEVGANGGVGFEVYGDGTLMAQKGPLTGSSASEQISVSVSGRAQVRLVANAGGGSVNYDHADWADAKFGCAPDTTPPTVTGRTPAAGATGVGVSTTVTATFSEPIDAASLTPASFTLTKQGAGSPVAATVAYDAAERRATLSPAAALDTATVYVATVKSGTGGLRDTEGNPLSADETWSFTTTSSQQQVTYLSALTPVSATNGYGPYEQDRSNGEQLAGDGQTITLGGVTFARGLGVHAASELVYAIPAGCTEFSASVGVDDEVGALGGLSFQVYGDATLLAERGPLTGASPTAQIDVDVTGRTQLRLVVTDGGNGLDYDHADWADAKLSC
jgi:hypothetical protein